MDLSAVRVALAARISTVINRTTATIPDDVNPPAAFVGSPVGSYMVDMTGNNQLTIPVIVLVSRAGGDPRAQDKIDAYLSTGTPLSLFDAIDAVPALGGACDYARVVGWQDYGGLYTFGESSYVGVQINVEVMA